MTPFTYNLPEHKIAQRPVCPPESAKLLTLNNKIGEILDTTYAKIPDDFIKDGDIFVFNDTKVIPARLFGQLKEKEVEILLLSRVKDGLWRCLGRPLKKLLPGSEVYLGALSSNSGLLNEVYAIIKERISEKEILVQFEIKNATKSISCIDELVFQLGRMPIPPYIRSGKSDQQDITDYQTIFAKVDGSVAAPTASLHFSKNLVDRMKDKGAIILHTTLHVGAASFLPLWTEENSEPAKSPGIELFKIDFELLAKLNEAKNKNKRVIAVGTTVVRSIESMIRLMDKNIDQSLCETDLFIKPGFEFKLCDALITNFHQPRTTHLLLVEAFCGEKNLNSMYEHALRSDYRFLSYGDGVFIY